MQLTVWTYEGPPHVGAMRVATAMQGVHYVLHAPQGDTYADLLFTMIERRDRAPAGDLHDVPGARPRRRHRRTVQDRGARRLRAVPAAGDARRRLLHRRADPGRSRRPRARARPADPGRAARAAGLPEARRTGARPRPSTSSSARSPGRAPRRHGAPRAAGAPALQHARARRRSASATATTSPRSPRCSTGSASTSTSSRRWARRPADLARLGDADFNVVLYPEIAGTAAHWLERTLRPAVDQDHADRRRRRRATSSPRSRRSPASIRAAMLATTRRGCPGTRARSTRPISPASASSSSATPPMPSPPPASPPTSSASRSSGSAPTAANSPARCARPPSATASRR